MVGIFLRLLEYHQGVLFLTTNRVQEFDKAFHSRISVALKYSELDATAREQVWRNFLEKAELLSLDPVPLSKYELNGRQIRSTIRLAQAIARDEGVPVAMTHLEQTITVALQFAEDVKQELALDEE